MQVPDVCVTPDGSHTNDDRRSASLDGLRALAALSVFVFHGWLYTMPTPDASNRSSVADQLVHEMRLGLVLFFVLTGFLLSRPWFAAALDQRSPLDLRRYVRSRVARIAPAYYVALIGSIGLLWNLAGTPGVRLPPVSELPLFLVFAQNLEGSSVMKLNPPMWTLAVEVSFYAILPVIGWIAFKLGPRRRTLALIPLALLALGVAYNYTIAGRGLGMTFSKTLAAMLPYFALGMLAALLMHGRATIGTRASRVLTAAGIALVAADVLVKSAIVGVGFDPTPYFPIIRDLPSATGFALLIAAAASRPRSPILGSRPLAWLGTISYGFYLWHVPVLLFLRGHGLLPLDPVLGTLVALGPLLAIAAMSWVTLEQPVIEWAKRRNALARAEQRRRLVPKQASGGGSVDRRPGGREDRVD